MGKFITGVLLAFTLAHVLQTRGAQMPLGAYLDRYSSPPIGPVSISRATTSISTFRPVARRSMIGTIRHFVDILD